MLYRDTYSSNPADYTLTTSPTITHTGSKTVYFVATNPNYQPAFGSAVVTVTPRAITLTSADASRAYNGAALTNSTVTPSGDGFVGTEGFLTTPTATGSITNVGSTSNTFTVPGFSAGTLATDYVVTPVEGTLTVTQATLRVQADDQQIAYPANRPATTALTYQYVDGAATGETPAYSGNLGYESIGSDPLSPNTYTDAITQGTLGLSNNDAFLAGNYTLVVLPGDLKVVNGTFTVDLTGGSWTYNGNPHGPSLTGTGSSDTVTYYTNVGGSWVEYGTTPPTVTNVSDGTVEVKVEVKRPGYEPATDTAFISITPATTTATATGYDEKYDGGAHGITVTPAVTTGSTVFYSLAEGTTPSDYTLPTSPTETNYTPGTTVYYVVTNPNYLPVYGSAVITIDPREIKITTANDSKPYDGDPLTNANWSFTTGSDAFFGTQGFATAAANGTITNVGSVDNGFAYTLKPGTLAANYDVSVTKGTLTITPATGMKVSAADVSKQYSGTAYGVSASSDKPDSTVLYRDTYSSNPADYTLTTSPTITHTGSKTVYFVATNPNYQPAFGSAVVTVTPRAITLTSADASRAYNGAALTNSTVTPSGDGFVGTEGFLTTPTATGSITNVGSTSNTFTVPGFSAGTLETDYVVTPVEGTLTVTRATLRVQADDKQIAYPNSRPATTALTYQYVDGAAAGETPAYSGNLGYTGLTADPLSPNTYTDAITQGTLGLSNNDAFLAGNYTLVVLPGDLKVVNGTFTVDLTGGSWTYNGNPHGPSLTGTTTGDTVTYYTNVGGSWVPFTGVPTVTNVSDGTVEVKVEVTRPGYEPATDTATIAITPATTTATATGYDEKYDGGAHGITVTPAVTTGSTVFYSLAEGTTPSDYTLPTSPTETNYTPGTTVYYVVTNPNYLPVYGSAVITIDPREIKITTANDSKPYDGDPLTNANWSFTTGSDAFFGTQGFATAAANGTITNVGSVDNGFAYTLKPGTLAANYDVSVTKGTLTITPATGMKVSAADVSKQYSGTAYGVSASSDKPDSTVLYRDTYSSNPADYTLTTSPTITHTGSKTVYFVATNPNYQPAFGSAVVTVTPRAITLTSADASRAYNGAALTNSTVTPSGDGFVGTEGFLTTPTATGSITNVGSTSNTFTVPGFSAGTLETDYVVTPVEGTLTVTRATLRVQADDKQIAYPNSRPATTALTYQYVDGAAAGETPAYSGNLGYTGLTADPLSPNTYTDAITQGTLGLSNNDAFLAGNYTLVVLPGDLKVVNGTFTVDLTGGSWTYNGNPHGPSLTGTTTGDTVTYYTNVGGSWVPFTGVPTVTNVSDGTVEVKVEVTRPGYEPATDTATIAITPATTTATATGYDEKYDGGAHGITVTPAVTTGSTVFYSLAEGTTPSDYTLPTSPTETNYTPGTTVYYVVTNPNYLPVYGSAVITIDPREIKITTANDSKPYDGDPLTNANWSFTTGSDAFFGTQGFATAAANGTITNVGSVDNGFAYTLKPGTLAANYDVSVTKGTLTITPATGMKVSAADVSKQYSGTAYGVSASSDKPDSTVLYRDTYSSNPADYTLTSSPTITHTGTKTIYFVATNPNYQPAFGSAVVTVTPRAIGILTSTASRMYDGTALRSTGWSYDLASDGFLGSEGFSLATTTGVITNVGSVDNGFNYTLNTNTQAADYVFSVTPGKLTVDPRPVLIAADEAEKNYGAVDPAFTYHYETGVVGGTQFYSVLPADRGSFTVTVDRTNTTENVGVYADVIEPSILVDAAVAANYDVYVGTADFTINPRVTYALNTTEPVTGFPGDQWFGYGTDATISDSTGIHRPGYHVTGWEDTTSGKVFAPGETIPAIDRNYSFKAVWEISLYNVIYDTKTNDPVTNVPENGNNLKYGDRYVVSTEIPYRSGYTFQYWQAWEVTGTTADYVRGSAFLMPDSNVVLSAVWTADESPVYYHPGFGADSKTEGGRFATDAIATVSGNMFTRPGYRFTGWSEGSAAAGVSRQPGATFIMPPRQVNFYAHWEQLFYTVTYYVSGGTGTGMDGAKPYAVYTNLPYGAAMPKPADPTLDGYSFDGWGTSIPATVPEGGLVIYGTLKSLVAPEPERIADAETPLAGPVWALLNLILAIATALASLLMLIGYLGKKKQMEDGIVVRETKKHGAVRLLTLLPGIGGIVAFILTENMRNPMVFTDRWTLLMVIIAAVQLVLVMFGIKRDKDPDEFGIEPNRTI